MTRETDMGLINKWVTVENSGGRPRGSMHDYYMEIQMMHTILLLYL